MSGGVVSLVDLPVHIGPHAPDVKAALLQCTEAQVAEFYRAWSSTDVGKTAIHNIVSTTKEFGPSQNALATSFGSPVKNMLMSPSRGSPMSPNGRLHAGAFSPPLSPSAGRASLLSPSRRSATSIDAASPRQFSLTPAGADESYPSAETIAAATSPVGYSPRTAAINAAFGFGAVGAVAHGHVPFSPTGGATGKLRIGQPGAGAGSSTSAGVTGAGASPSSPMSPSSHNGAGGSNSSSSPGIAIRVSPSSAAASAGGAGGSSGISLRLGATSMGNRSHSAEGALAGSSGGNGSPIRSPAVTYSGFSAEMDGPGFSPTRSIGSFALSSALAAAGGSGGPALPISPRIMRSISAPPLGAPAGAAGGSMVMPTLGSAGLGGGASEGAAGSPSGTGVQSAVSSPASSPSMSSANSPVASPVPFAATSSISISAPASFSAAASSSLPPRSPREVSPSSLTAAAAGAASSSPASSFSASLAAAAAEGKTGDHHAAEEGKGDDHHHAAVASVSITTTDASGAAATAVTAAAADSSVRDLASTLAAVTISTGSSATAPSATEEAKANDVAAASSAASAAALVEPATAASSSSQQPLSGLTSSQANSVASSSSAKAAAAAAASKPQQPGIPTFYSREQGGAISLGLKRKPASQPPAPIIPAPVAPKVSNGQPPQPVPGRGKPLRSMPGQTLPEMLPLMIDLFTKHNCAGRAPDHPYAKVNAASEKHNATVIANNNSSRGKGKDAGKKGAAAAGGGRGRASSIGSSKGVVGGGRTGSSGSLTRTKSGKSLTSSANNSDAENDSDDDGASQQPPLRPIVNVQVRVAGCSVSWEDAHRAVSVDHFAAVTKPICGFPSFFAAPLFRRLKSTYLGNTNNSNGGRNHREGVPIVPADWNAEAAAMAANVGVLITAASKSNSSGSGSGSSVEQEGNALAGAHASAASAAGGNGLATSRSSAGPHSNRPRSGSSVTNGNLSPSANGAAGAGGAAVVDRVLEVEVRANPPSQDDASSRDTSGMISLPVFMQYWREEMEGYDHVERFFRLMKQRKNAGIEAPDFMPYLEELLAYHPGLAFLESTPEFQEKYARTVIARMFYTCDPLCNRVIDVRSLRTSNVLSAFQLVDVEEDINLVTDYFSYEHFYVLYCKFWELDADHDFQLSRADLSRLTHLTPAVLDRVMARAGRAFTAARSNDTMGYEDFCIFFMASEDKTHPSSLRYWFNVCDVDGDGVLTASDLRYFYPDQAKRMRDHGIEVVKFEDVLCQLHDLLKPKVEGRIKLSDFVSPDRIKLTGVLFNAMFDLDKFTRFEGREAMYVKQAENYASSQWDRYAQIEYTRLASEEEEAQNLVNTSNNGGGGINVAALVGGVGAAANIGGWGP